MTRTLDLTEAADFLKIDRTTMLKKAGDGEIPGAQIGRAWVFLEDDLIGYLRAQAADQMRRRQESAALDASLNRKTSRRKRLLPDLPDIKPVRKRAPDDLPRLAGAECD